VLLSSSFTSDSAGHLPAAFPSSANRKARRTSPLEAAYREADAAIGGIIRLLKSA